MVCLPGGSISKIPRRRSHRSECEKFTPTRCVRVYQHKGSCTKTDSQRVRMNRDCGPIQWGTKWFNHHGEKMSKKGTRRSNQWCLYHWKKVRVLILPIITVKREEMIMIFRVVHICIDSIIPSPGKITSRRRQGLSIRTIIV